MLARHATALVLAVALAASVGTVVVERVSSRGSPPEGRFTVGDGGRIYDPRGRLFVPVGVNANGPNWVWPGPTVGQSRKMAGWHFNSLRVSTCMTRCLPTPRYATNNDLRRLIAEYTAKRHVIIIAQHQYGAGGDGGAGGHLGALRRWWRVTARRYRANPYVWFNPLNEPVPASGPAALRAWWRITTALADVIHAAAPRSMLLLDGSSYGQEKGTWACSASPAGKPPGFWLRNSSALRYGSALQRRYGDDSVAIGLHVYGQWAGNPEYGCRGPASDPYRHWRRDLNTYLDRARRADLPVVVGEYGSTLRADQEGWSQSGAWESAHMLMEQVAPKRTPKIGVQFWHGACCDTHPLMDPDADWTDWSGHASQLTWQGRDLVRYAKLVNP